MPQIVIRLLTVMLNIIAIQGGKTYPKKSDCGKNIHKYPPTMTPIVKAPKTQPSSLRFPSSRITLAATRFASGPNMTS